MTDPVAPKLRQDQTGHKNPRKKTLRKLGQDTEMLGKAALQALLLMGFVGTTAAQERGPVTNLPLPRFVSMKASEGNVRRGPSLTHRIDWVYKRRDMPLEITAEHGNWRRVRDRDGAGGWMHYSLLSGVRTVIVETDMLALNSRATGDGTVTARLEAGVIARLGECSEQQCELTAGGFRGWAPKSTFWGARPDEIRD
jgi:SH3-like domain-containing protein